MKERVLAGDEESPRWSFFRRKVIGDGKTVYMRRLYIICTPWFGFMLHRIYRPDRQRDLHDHPWNFLSFILRGLYAEKTDKEPESVHLWANDDPVHPRIWFNYKRAEDRHSIRWISRVPVWTLVIHGVRRRNWGFWVDGGSRFIPYLEYEKLNNP